MPCNADFGIIDNFDKRKTYSEFEHPVDFNDVLKSYRCISIDHDTLCLWSDNMAHIKTYNCCCDNEATGLNMYGVTLIPPESLKQIIQIAMNYINSAANEDYQDTETVGVVDVLKEAMKENKWAIHFGV